MDERITLYFEEHKNEIVDDLRTLVSVPSVGGEPEEGAPYGANCRKALEIAKEMAERCGFETEVRGDRVCVIEYGPGEPALGVLAHLDVVPEGEGWTVTEPFNMLLKDGILYGRGVSDDKGPAVATFYALRAIKELGIPLKKRVQVLLGSDEERGSSDVAWYREHYKLPPMVFSPDAGFPVATAEKGRMEIKVTGQAGNGPLVSLKGGTASNVVPADCKAVIEGIDQDTIKLAAKDAPVEVTVEQDGDKVLVTCIGKSCHGAYPFGGVNAVCAMLGLLSSLPIGDGAEAKAIRALSNAVPFGDFGGHAFDAYCEDADSGNLTVNLGVISYDRERGFEAYIDCRVPACGDGHVVADKLRKKLDGEAGMELISYVEPHSTPRDSKLVQVLLKVYEEHTGLKGEPYSMGGLTYVHGIPGGVAYGGSLSHDTNAHQSDERLPLEDILKCGAMYAQAIVELCGE